MSNNYCYKKHSPCTTNIYILLWKYIFGLNHLLIVNSASTHLEPIDVEPDIPGLRVDSHLYNNSKLSYIFTINSIQT